MGEVWASTDTVLGRSVAVKTLLGGRGTDPGFLSRFRHEAQTMASLRNPGVVAVYDFGDTEDGAYLVMARVDGQPLNRILADRWQLTVAETMSIVAQAGRALQAAHDAGIVHRDVKPGNLIIEPDGTVVLVDFGVARSANSVTLTGAREVVGTALYIAPEQVSKQVTGPAADIYALGALAYHCLTGQPPFLGDNPLAVALQHVTDEPPPLPQELPRAVRDLVGIALAKDPADRFSSAAAMATAAEQAANLDDDAEAAAIAAETAASTSDPANSPTPPGLNAATSGIGTAGTGAAAGGGPAAGGIRGAGSDAADGGATRPGGTGSVDSRAVTQAVAAGAAAGRAMVGAPRFADDLPVGPAQDGNTMVGGQWDGTLAGQTGQTGQAGQAGQAGAAAPGVIPGAAAVGGLAAGQNRLGANEATGLAGTGDPGGTAGPSGQGGTASLSGQGGTAAAPGQAATNGTKGTIGTNGAPRPAGSGLAGSSPAGSGTAGSGPAGGSGNRAAAAAGIGGVGELADRRNRLLLAIAAAVLVLVGLGTTVVLADPFGIFGKEPAVGTTPGVGAPSLSTSPEPAATRKKSGGGQTTKPQTSSRTSTAPSSNPANPAPSVQPTGTETESEEPTDPATTTPAEQPTTAAPTQTQTSSDSGDSGTSGGNEDNSDPGNTGSDN
uniref:protein kinase domain-containing protein n=1 Tax=Actinoplanes awajinensis TaxID=135946 RepID=UPI00373FDDF4